MVRATRGGPFLVIFGCLIGVRALRVSYVEFGTADFDTQVGAPTVAHRGPEVKGLSVEPIAQHAESLPAPVHAAPVPLSDTLPRVVVAAAVRADCADQHEFLGAEFPCAREAVPAESGLVRIYGVDPRYIMDRNTRRCELGVRRAEDQTDCFPAWFHALASVGAPPQMFLDNARSQGVEPAMFMTVREVRQFSVEDVILASGITAIDLLKVDTEGLDVPIVARYANRVLLDKGVVAAQVLFEASFNNNTKLIHAHEATVGALVARLGDVGYRCKLSMHFDIHCLYPQAMAALLWDIYQNGGLDGSARHAAFAVVSHSRSCCTSHATCMAAASYLASVVTRDCFSACAAHPQCNFFTHFIGEDRCYLAADCAMHARVRFESAVTYARLQIEQNPHHRAWWLANNHTGREFDLNGHKYAEYTDAEFRPAPSGVAAHLPQEIGRTPLPAAVDDDSCARPPLHVDAHGRTWAVVDLKLGGAEYVSRVEVAESIHNKRLDPAPAAVLYAYPRYAFGVYVAQAVVHGGPRRPADEEAFGEQNPYQHAVSPDQKIQKNALPKEFTDISTVPAKLRLDVRASNVTACHTPVTRTVYDQLTAAHATTFRCDRLGRFVFVGPVDAQRGVCAVRVFGTPHPLA